MLIYTTEMFTFFFYALNVLEMKTPTVSNWLLHSHLVSGVLWNKLHWMDLQTKPIYLNYAEALCSLLSGRNAPQS